jgi:hypothetical protein
MWSPTFFAAEMVYYNICHAESVIEEMLDWTITM